jgi:hypothetical protein
MDYSNSFLLTHRGFISSEELIDLIVLRYQIRKPRKVDWVTFRRNTMIPVRFRCVNVLKSWITLRPEDFCDNPALVAKTREFAAHFEQNSVTATTLHRLLDKALAKTAQGKQYNLAPPPEPLLYDGVPPVGSVLDLHPQEIARQLCLVEHRLWAAIRPHELVSGSWSKPNKEDLCPNVLAMVKASTDMTNYVAADILSYSDLRQRVAVLSQWIMVAQHSRDCNNYNAVMEILAALSSSAVHRLRTTWELLPSETWEAHDALRALTDSEGNWPCYRETIRAATPPCVPYLGLFLTDLTFISEGNPNLIPGSNLINFSKWRTVAAVIKEVLRLQGQPMNLVAIPFIQEYVLGGAASVSSGVQVRPVRAPPTEWWIRLGLVEKKVSIETQLWERSLVLEETRPKNMHLTEKEKSARVKLSRDIFKEVVKKHKKMRKPQPADYAPAPAPAPAAPVQVQSPRAAASSSAAPTAAPTAAASAAASSSATTPTPTQHQHIASSSSSSTSLPQ